MMHRIFVTLILCLLSHVWGFNLQPSRALVSLRTRRGTIGKHISQRAYAAPQSQESGFNGDNAPAPITFASYVVYKGKGAVTLKAIAPSYTSLSNKARNVAREGGLLLEFALASGQREYNWAKKGTFLLDVNECGTLLYNINQVQLGSKNNDAVEFLHDPNIGTPDAGKTNKKLRWVKMSDGVFITLQVTDKSGQTPQVTTYTLPLSWGEIEVIKTLISYCIPRFLAFDKVWDNPGLSLPPGVMPPNPPPAPEWKSLN